MQSLHDLANGSQALRFRQGYRSELRNELAAIADRDDEHRAVTARRLENARERVDRGAARAGYHDDAQRVDVERVDERRIASDRRWRRRVRNVRKNLESNREVAAWSL